MSKKDSKEEDLLNLENNMKQLLEEIRSNKLAIDKLSNEMLVNITINPYDFNIAKKSLLAIYRREEIELLKESLKSPFKSVRDLAKTFIKKLEKKVGKDPIELAISSVLIREAFQGLERVLEEDDIDALAKIGRESKHKGVKTLAWALHLESYFDVYNLLAHYAKLGTQLSGGFLTLLDALKGDEKVLDDLKDKYVYLKIVATVGKENTAEKAVDLLAQSEHIEQNLKRSILEDVAKYAENKSVKEKAKAKIIEITKLKSNSSSKENGPDGPSIIEDKGVLLNGASETNRAFKGKIKNHPKQLGPNDSNIANKTSDKAKKARKQTSNE